MPKDRPKEELDPHVGVAGVVLTDDGLGGAGHMLPPVVPPVSTPAPALGLAGIAKLNLGMGEVAVPDKAIINKMGVNYVMMAR